jgi:hypothetical protein
VQAVLEVRNGVAHSLSPSFLPVGSNVVRKEKRNSFKKNKPKKKNWV